MAIIEADTPIIPDVQNLGDIDDDDEARFPNSDEQAEEVRRAEKEMAAERRRRRRAPSRRSGVRRMMSLTSAESAADVFVAARANKGKSQRAILDFRSKLAALSKHESDDSD